MKLSNRFHGRYTDPMQRLHFPSDRCSFPFVSSSTDHREIHTRVRAINSRQSRVPSLFRPRPDRFDGGPRCFLFVFFRRRAGRRRLSLETAPTAPLCDLSIKISIKERAAAVYRGGLRDFRLRYRYGATSENIARNNSPTVKRSFSLLLIALRAIYTPGIQMRLAFPFSGASEPRPWWFPLAFSPPSSVCGRVHSNSFLTRCIPVKFVVR